MSGLLAYCLSFLAGGRGVAGLGIVGYFDTTVATHLALLPSTLRDHSDLVNIAAAAEADVLAEYLRERIDPGQRAYVLDAGQVTEAYVWLAGYHTNPQRASPRLADALRREIASCIRWRAARDAKKPGVSSEAAGEPRTSKAYLKELEQPLPPDFGRHLRPFSVRGTAWVI